MESLLFFIFIFIVIFLVYYFLCLYKYNTNKLYKIKEITFIKSKYKLDINKINIKKLLKTISLINSFIISLTSIIVFSFVDNIYFLAIISIIILFVLIYIFYMIVLKYLIKKNIFN